MTLYVETSAVLAWLFDEDGAPVGMRTLADADRIVTSMLTLIEADRAMLRSVALGQRSKDQVAGLRTVLVDVSAAWNVQPLDLDTIDRARQPFPDDSIRSLDAIHLASAVVARASLGDMDLLSLDERIRSNAAALGFRVLPE